jgi:hypothetical protein
MWPSKVFILLSFANWRLCSMTLEMLKGSLIDSERKKYVLNSTVCCPSKSLVFLSLNLA